MIEKKNKKILYFDCFSGISGDMTLGALLDLDLGNYDYLISQLESLNINGWRINMERRDKTGINSNYIKVILEDFHEHEHEHEHNRGHEHHHNHEHRDFSDILHIIESSKITNNAKELSKNIFKRLAEAEAKVHGIDKEEIGKVSFHEVGAVDSIIDIVGSAVLLDLIISKNQINMICCSVISDGYGFTHCKHGKIPVPVPAVVEVFANAGVKTRQTDIPKELVTPTGAAIISEIIDKNNNWIMPGMTALKTGYGAGTRDLEIPNVVRVILGEDINNNISEITEITVIETNIDDCSAEILAYTMEKLLQSGAKDVFFTPVYMKKNRPAVKLTVLCKNRDIDKIAKVIFSETTTIGLRIREEKRICLERKSRIIKTVYGDLKVKEIEFDGEIKFTPEYEDAKKLAETIGVPLYKIYESIKTQGD